MQRKDDEIHHPHHQQTVFIAWLKARIKCSDRGRYHSQEELILHHEVSAIHDSARLDGKLQPLSQPPAFASCFRGFLPIATVRAVKILCVYFFGVSDCDIILALFGSREPS